MFILSKQQLFFLIMSVMVPIHTIMSKSSWRNVEEIVHNKVVQIFVQVAEHDWLQPYRTPTHYQVRGSGFFIDETGKIITNAHVVHEAVQILVVMPNSKRLMKARIIGIYPERDIALIQIDEADVAFVKEKLGAIPFLSFGDSDLDISLADEVVAIGYPLGQEESIKITKGIISGRQTINGSQLIQTDTPINQGNSGGPLVNRKGEVIGVNSCGFHARDAQNINYAIPSNDVLKVLPLLQKSKLIHKPFLGVLTIKTNDYLTEYLGNPEPGGCYVAEVIKGSPLEQAGVKQGDMIYKIDDHSVDMYGMVTGKDMQSKDLGDYIANLRAGDLVTLQIYRNGEEKNITVALAGTDAFPIRYMYPWHEKIDYEVIAGMVVMPLTMNHVKLLAEQAPGLWYYTTINKIHDPVLVITHIFPNSLLASVRTLSEGFTLREVNHMPVRTMDDLRKALKESVETKQLVIKASDTLSCSSDNMLLVLPIDAICQEAEELAEIYRYPISQTVRELIQLCTQYAGA
jgi:serine protease Do